MTEQPSDSHDELADDEPTDDVEHETAELTDEERREALLADTPEEIEARSPQRVETGNPAVDDVIASLEGLDGIPVDEHVALFEQAHEQLRRTLSGAGDDQG